MKVIIKREQNEILNAKKKLKVVINDKEIKYLNNIEILELEFDNKTTNQLYFQIDWIKSEVVTINEETSEVLNILVTYNSFITIKTTFKKFVYYASIFTIFILPFYSKLHYLAKIIVGVFSILGLFYAVQYFLFITLFKDKFFKIIISK